MDLEGLKNLDVKDLLNKIKTGSLSGILSDKKALIKIGVFGGSLLIFLIFYYSLVAPKINAQKEKIAIMNENQNKVSEYLANIDVLQAEVNILEPEYKKSSKLFHSRKEVEDLYQNISNFAMTNGLSIINIKKGEPEPSDDGETPLYYKIPVNYKIQGNYLGYLKFRRALSKSSKVINYEKETINVDKATGSIISEGTISIVGLPDEYKS